MIWHLSCFNNFIYQQWLQATLWCLDPGMLLMDEQWELILWDTLINTLDHLDHQASMLISMIRNSLLTSAGMCGYRKVSKKFENKILWPFAVKILFFSTKQTLSWKFSFALFFFNPFCDFFLNSKLIWNLPKEFPVSHGYSVLLETYAEQTLHQHMIQSY